MRSGLVSKIPFAQHFDPVHHRYPEHDFLGCFGEGVDHEGGARKRKHEIGRRVPKLVHQFVGVAQRPEPNRESAAEPGDDQPACNDFQQVFRWLKPTDREKDNGQDKKGNCGSTEFQHQSGKVNIQNADVSVIKQRQVVQQRANAATGHITPKQHAGVTG